MKINGRAVKRFPIECCAQTQRAHFRITTLCNANCAFCLGNFIADGGEHHSFEYVAESLLGARKQGLKRIVLSGGEPTIHPQITEIVAFAKKAGFETVQIVSNGIRFAEPSFTEALAKAGLDEVTVSIHGPNAEIHDAAVGRKGAFDALCTGVRNLQRFPGIVLSADITCSKPNVGHLRETVEFTVDKLAITRDLNLISIAPTGAAWSNKESVFPPLELLEPAFQSALEFIDSRKLIAHVLVLPPKYLGNYVRYRQEAEKMVEEVMVRESQGFFEGKKAPCEGLGCNYCGIQLVCKKTFNMLNAVRDGKAPKKAKMRVSEACNNNCSFCDQKKNGTFSEFGEIAAKMLAFHELGVEELAFTGPDASIHPQFSEMVEKASALGFKEVSLESNGRMLASKGFAKKIADAGLDRVTISLHGHTQELHERYTRAANSFNQALAGFQNASDAGLDVFSNTMILKKNFPFLEDVAVLLKKLHLKGSAFAFPNPSLCVYKKLDAKTGVSVSDPQWVIPKLSELNSFVSKAVNVLAPNVSVQGIPLCFAQGMGKYASNKQFAGIDSAFFGPRGKIGATGIAQEIVSGIKFAPSCCDSCPSNSACDGVFEKYAWLHGFEELSPK